MRRHLDRENWGKWSIAEETISRTGKIEARSGLRTVLPIGLFLPVEYEGWQYEKSLFTIAENIRS